jgi:hypothetical protein
MAALDFPNSPAVGDKWPQIPGQPVYTWDGEKWVTMGAQIEGPGDMIPLEDEAVGSPGTSGKYSREDHVHPLTAGEVNRTYVDDQDALRVLKAGDTMSGPLVLPADPTANLQAATKQYVDSHAGGGAASAVTFAPGGNVAATNVQAAIAELDNEKVAKAGDTMTGPLALPADPTANLQASTKQYVDAVALLVPHAATVTPLAGATIGAVGTSVKYAREDHVHPGGSGGGGGASLAISDTPPAGAADGSLWWESDSGQLYVRYNDGNSSQWVVVAAPSTSFTAAAPIDALAYNGIQINGSMDISQELGTAGGVNPSTGYALDGYLMTLGGTMAVTPIQAATTLFPGFRYCLAVTTQTAQPSLGASDNINIIQKIEGLRCSRLSWGTANAQPITIGFWSGHTRPGVYSLSVRNNAGNRSYAAAYTHAASVIPQYNVITIPGDTVGTWPTDNTSSIVINFCLASGATYIAPSANTWQAGIYVAAPGQVNSVAATTDILRITGVTVHPGIQAPSAAQSPLIMRPPDQELQLCKRYWQTVYAVLENQLAAGAQLAAGFTFVPEMRVTPTLNAFTQDAAASIGALQYLFTTNKKFAVQATTTGAGRQYFYGHLSADARM